MELSGTAQAWVHLVLVWVGFGTVVGFVANMFLPTGNSSGFLSSLVIGIAGSCAGPVALTFLLDLKHFDPISPIGFAVAVIASVILLLLYRCLRFVAGIPTKKVADKKTGH